jgi:hypothetical protein
MSIEDELLARVLDAHGGLENWERVSKLEARLSLGGRSGRAAVGPASWGT